MGNQHEDLEDVTPDAGGVIEAEPTPETPQEAPETDWKAEARKWEARAKKSEKSLNAANAKIAEAEAREQERAEAAQRAAERAEWVTAVGDSTGVPKDVLEALEASSADELQRKAEGMAGYFRRDALPAVPGDGRHAETPGASDMRAFVRALMGNQ
jgi:hypothetical protein